jgi:hypothetical protein
LGNDCRVAAPSSRAWPAHTTLIIVPTLCVGMLREPLCGSGRWSVPGWTPTQSMGAINGSYFWRNPKARSARPTANALKPGAAALRNMAFVLFVSPRQLLPALLYLLHPCSRRGAYFWLSWTNFHF